MGYLAGEITCTRENRMFVDNGKAVSQVPCLVLEAHAHGLEALDSVGGHSDNGTERHVLGHLRRFMTRFCCTDPKVVGRVAQSS